MIKGKKNNFKLYYFDANFRAQVIRALLHWAKVDWEDIKLEKDNFAKLVNEGFFSDSMNKLPVLEYKGVFFSQSHAIEVYLAKKFKKMGDSEEDEYKIICLQGIIEDIVKYLKPIIFPENDEEERSQEKNMNDFINNKFPYFLRIIEKLYLNTLRNTNTNFNNISISNNTYSNYTNTNNNNTNNFAPRLSSNYEENINSNNFKINTSINSGSVNNGFNDDGKRQSIIIETNNEKDSEFNYNLKKNNNNYNNNININDKIIDNLDDITNVSYFLSSRISLADFLIGVFLYNLIVHPLRINVLKPIVDRECPNISKLMDKLVKEDFSDYYLKVHNLKSLV